MKKETDFSQKKWKEIEKSRAIPFGELDGRAIENMSMKDDCFDCPENMGSKWSKVGEDYIISVNQTFDMLDPGYYTIAQSPQFGMYFVKQDIETNKIYRLPNRASDIILNDISKFWTLEDTYKKYNRVFRRNYLLYSAPGTGKTSLISLMCKELIEKYNGIVFSLSNSESIALFPSAIRRIKSIEPDRKIIAIIEDIDNFVSATDMYNNGGGNALETMLLNILDGNLKTGNVVTIATTNYIQVLTERYKNRPSRFDIVIEFPLPNAESRKIFIEKTVLPEDLEKINIDEWVRKTEGYTIDHLNELILLYFVFGHSEEEAFNRMDNMVNNNSKLKNEESVRDKGLGFDVF